jgi:hypothetical protein
MNFSKQLWSFIALKCGNMVGQKRIATYGLLQIEKAFDAWASCPPKRLV